MTPMQKRMTESHLWRGGRSHTSYGYVRIYQPDHPRSNQGYVYEHIVIAEAALGRHLDAIHQVHHVDLCRANNTNSNLVVCEDDSYHKLLHQRTEAFAACGNASALRCSVCQRYDRQEDIRVYRNNSPHHVACHRAARRNRSIAARGQG